MKINTHQAIKLLQTAQAVIVDESPILNDWNSCNPNGQSDNEVLLFSWADDEGLEYSVKFTEEGLNNATFTQGIIYADDSEGEPSQIQLYTLEVMDTLPA